MSIEQALTAMGYRQINGKWAKPIGYMLFVVEVDNLNSASFRSFFKSVNGAPCVYDHKNFDARSGLRPLKWLKDVEGYTRTDVNVYDNSEFEFITLEQVINGY